MFMMFSMLISIYEYYNYNMIFNWDCAIAIIIILIPGLAVTGCG